MDTQDTATRLAYTRTHLANERTYAAWLRTGLSLAAAGYAIGTLGPAGPVLHGIGVVLVLAGAAVVALGGWSFRRVCATLAGTGSPPPAATQRLVLTLSAILAVLLATGAFLL